MKLSALKPWHNLKGYGIKTNHHMWKRTVSLQREKIQFCKHINLIKIAYKINKISPGGNEISLLWHMFALQTTGVWETYLWK